MQPLFINSSSRAWSDETSPIPIKVCLGTHALTAEAVEENWLWLCSCPSCTLQQSGWKEAQGWVEIAQSYLVRVASWHIALPGTYSSFTGSHSWKLHCNKDLGCDLRPNWVTIQGSNLEWSYEGREYNTGCPLNWRRWSRDWWTASPLWLELHNKCSRGAMSHGAPGCMQFPDVHPRIIIFIPPERPMMLCISCSH